MLVAADRRQPPFAVILSHGACPDKSITLRVSSRALPQRCRKELTRLPIAEGVFDWRFSITRDRDVPVAVSAAVRIIRAWGRDGCAGRYGCLRITDGTDKRG